jgi:hypothetical protein
MTFYINDREAADLRIGVYTPEQVADRDFMESEYQAAKVEIARRGWEVARAPYDAFSTINGVKKVAIFVSCFTNAEKQLK